MKFAIVSDTHDNVANVNKVIDFLGKEKITTLLHCGDICSQETIDQATTLFKGTIHWVRGNGDFDLPHIPEKLELAPDGTKVFFNHYPDIAKTAAESGKYDLVFYGHTHRPWVEQVGNCILANPGELAGQRFKPTFALYDTKTHRLALKILEKLYY